MTSDELTANYAEQTDKNYLSGKQEELDRINLINRIVRAGLRDLAIEVIRRYLLVPGHFPITTGLPFDRAKT